MPRRDPFLSLPAAVGNKAILFPIPLAPCLHLPFILSARQAPGPDACLLHHPSPSPPGVLQLELVGRSLLEAVLVRSLFLHRAVLPHLTSRGVSLGLDPLLPAVSWVNYMPHECKTHL